MSDKPPTAARPPAAGAPIIEFQNASFAYDGRPALDSLSFSVGAGEFLGVIGPNGSGKTTLLKAILGLIAPTQGRAAIFDCTCHELRCHHRAMIGYLPQRSRTDPNFPVTVFEAVLMGRYSTIGLFRRPAEADRELAASALNEVGLLELRDRPLGRLSGGQQQRVFIARALAQQPRVLLLDEPTTGIDAPTQASLLALVRRLHRERGLTILFVTHDINLVSPAVDRLALLNGRLVAIGPPAQILTKETLAPVYGETAIVTNHAGGAYVIVADHHHA
ncbi:MAG: metal ABC transporter ATP-binding protein [Nitrospirota bacterium]